MVQVIEDIKYDFCDLMILPKRSIVDSRSKVCLQRTMTFKHSPIQYTGIPIIGSNMDGVGTFEMSAALHLQKMSVALHKFYSVNELVSFFGNPANNPTTFYTMGITESDEIKFSQVMNSLPYDQKCKYLCIDVANGYSRKFVNFVSKMRERYPDVVIMAGNVVTGDMVYDLLERGADIVKNGIGSGSVCTTRRLTGVGYPQLSSIFECADAAHGAGGQLCSDGGITCAGDAAKAFSAGADFVMIGGFFAGHQEGGGEVIIDPITNETYIKFYGMSSADAMEKHYGEKASYRAAEGKTVTLKYKGPIKFTVEELLGGIRSTCTYVGAFRLKDLPKCCTFIKVNRQLNNVYGN